jgi:DNA polymerase
MSESLLELYGLIAERVRFERELGQSLYRTDAALPDHLLTAPLPPRAPAAPPSAPINPAATTPVQSPVQSTLADALPAALSKDAAAAMARLSMELRHCQHCQRHLSRNTVVFGEGTLTAALMFVGDAPSSDDDLTGVAFVGEAGQLLNRMIKAMGLRRDQVYLAFLNKCRIPEARPASASEMNTCGAFLMRQIDIVNPRIIVALGQTVARWLLKTDAPITAMRGRFHDLSGRLVMPTYNLEYLIRKPEAKRPVWEDLKAVMEKLPTIEPGTED